MRTKTVLLIGILVTALQCAELFAQMSMRGGRGMRGARGSTGTKSGGAAVYKRDGTMSSVKYTFAGGPRALKKPKPLGAKPGSVQRKNLALDLGEGVKVEFVWVDALTCLVGRYEVTNGEYRKFRPTHDSKSHGEKSLNNDRQPAVFVSYDDAEAFADWVTAKCASQIPRGWCVRLPEWSEWLRYARCGDDRKYPWGQTWPPKYGNYHDQSAAGLIPGRAKPIEGYNDGAAVTCPVENSGKNDWGLYGVGGNVWEWTRQAFSERHRIARGASWKNTGVGTSPGRLACESRSSNWTLSRNSATDAIGFRLLLAPFSPSKDGISRPGWGDKVTREEIAFFTAKARTSRVHWRGVPKPIECPAVEGTIAALSDNGTAIMAFSAKSVAAVGPAATPQQPQGAIKTDTAKLVELRDIKPARTDLPFVTAWKTWAVDRASLSRCAVGKRIFAVHTGNGECMILPSIPEVKTAMARLGTTPYAEYAKRMQTPTAKLARAMRAGDLAAIGSVLQNGSKPTVATLISAMRSKKPEESLKLLLGTGVNPNGKDALDSPPIMAAVQARSGAAGLVSILVEAGANPNCADVAGNLPITQAVSSRNVAVVKALVDGGADLSLRNNHRKTPLEVAKALSGYGSSKKKSKTAIVSYLQSVKQPPRPVNEVFKGVPPKMVLRVGAYSARKDIVDFAVAGGADPWAATSLLENMVTFGTAEALAQIVSREGSSANRTAALQRALATAKRRKREDMVTVLENAQ